jgi:hypothetical protein
MTTEEQIFQKCHVQDRNCTSYWLLLQGGIVQSIPSTVAISDLLNVKSKAVPLHAMEALGRRGGIAPTHSRPRH